MFIETSMNNTENELLDIQYFLENITESKCQ